MQQCLHNAQMIVPVGRAPREAQCRPAVRLPERAKHPEAAAGTSRRGSGTEEDEDEDGEGDGDAERGPAFASPSRNRLRATGRPIAAVQESLFEQFMVFVERSIRSPVAEAVGILLPDAPEMRGARCLQIAARARPAPASRTRKI